jgi:hypothetical protein
VEAEAEDMSCSMDVVDGERLVGVERLWKWVRAEDLRVVLGVVDVRQDATQDWNGVVVMVLISCVVVVVLGSCAL